MKFKVLFLESVDRFLHDYHRNGFVTAGSNGPHNTPETALRNSSHWIISLVRAFQLTGNEHYKNSAVILGDKLLDRTFRPYGFSFLAREGKGVDRCNGLIGQAWVIEALTALHRCQTTRLIVIWAFNWLNNINLIRVLVFGIVWMLMAPLSILIMSSIISFGFVPPPRS